MLCWVDSEKLTITRRSTFSFSESMRLISRSFISSFTCCTAFEATTINHFSPIVVKQKYFHFDRGNNYDNSSSFFSVKKPAPSRGFEFHGFLWSISVLFSPLRSVERRGCSRQVDDQLSGRQTTNSYPKCQPRHHLLSLSRVKAKESHKKIKRRRKRPQMTSAL